MADPWAAEAGPIEIPEDLLVWIKPELEPGERLLWVSRAGQEPSFRRRGGLPAAGTWAFGLMALAFAMLVLSLGTVLRLRQAEAALITFSIAFGAVGSVIGLFTLAAWNTARGERRLRGRRFYALTDRRAIVWSPVAGSDAVTVHVYPRGSIRPEQIERTQFPDGGGTLSILGGYSALGKFEGIADVRRVEGLVRRFLVAPGPDPAP